MKSSSHKKVIRFFVDRKMSIEDLPYVSLLYPFWGCDLAVDSYNFNLFKTYNFDTRYYTLTDNINDADFILMPHRFNLIKNTHRALFEAYVRMARQSRKPLLVDGTGDIEYPIHIPGVYVLRIGGYRSERSVNEIHIPLYAQDLTEEFLSGSIHVRTKQPVPVVGFAGWTRMSFAQYIKTAIKELPIRIRSVYNRAYMYRRKGIFYRSHTIDILKKSLLIDARIIERQSFSAHVTTAEKEIATLRQEFVHNLLHADYGLAVRGDANASVRLYEIMSLGRIPLIIDTDMVLPLSNIIDYRTFSIIVDYKDISRIDQIVYDFHTQITAEQFVSMQKEARRVFVEYVRVDGLTKHIMGILHDICVDKNIHV